MEAACSVVLSCSWWKQLMHSETTDGSLENITQYLILPEAFSTSDCTSEVPTECVHQEKGFKGLGNAVHKRTERGTAAAIENVDY